MEENAMRLSARRTLTGAAVLLAGIIVLNRYATGADDAGAPVPEGEFKALFEQDAKNLPDMIKMGQKTGAANKSKASRAVKSDAMMIAFYANSRIGAKGGDDAKMAALRDAAIKLAAAGGKKKFDDAEKLAKDVTLSGTGGKGEAKQMTVAQLAAAADLDIEELMYQFKKTSVGGLGTEEEVNAAAKKAGTVTPAAAAAIAARVLVVADYSEHVTVKFDAKKTPKDWTAFNKDMRIAAKDLQTAAAGKDNKKIQTAFDKLDRSCVACHEKMK
jgi:hypothetical protein